MKTGLYVRVSTEEQAREGYSIKAQIERLTQYAKAMNWEVVDVYIDEGRSAKNIDERPELNRLLVDIESKHIENVVIFKIDRLTRSIRDLLNLVEFFADKHVGLCSLTEAIDTQTAVGRMFLKIIGIFAEFERENMIERVKVGFRQKVEEGYSLCARNISYGYNREKGNKDLEVNEEEAAIVRRVYDLFLNNSQSIRSIAMTLNNEGILSKNGTLWSGTTTKQILTNPTYIGKVRYGINRDDYYETDGRHKAIISEELFYRVQAKLRQKSKTIPTKHPKADAYYLGVLYCGLCEQRLSTHWTYHNNKDGTTYSQLSYVCVGVSKFKCGASGMKHGKVENAFIDYIDAINPLDFQSQSISTEHQDLKPEISILEEKLKEAEMRHLELMNLFSTSAIGFEEYQAMAIIIKNLKLELAGKIAILNSTIKTEDVPISIDEIVNTVKAQWSMLTNEEKMLFLHQFIDKIYVVNEVPEDSRQGKVKILDVNFENTIRD